MRREKTHFLNAAQNKDFIQATQELAILEDDVKNAYAFFRKKLPAPIYLLMGPERFGKSTLLSRAGLSLKNSFSENLKQVLPTKYCSWWFATESIYVDTAGTYTKPDVTRPSNDFIWQGFIKLLQKYFGKKSIAGILVMLDLPMLSQDLPLMREALFCIRERIYELANITPVLPLHIIFTKCDRITGFTDFFSLLDDKERHQPFGIDFTDLKTKNDPIQTFEDKFDEVIKHLNARVIDRIHSEKDLAARLRIKSFPLQLESLRSMITEVLGKIPSSKHILLSGIYFTSSIQEGATIDNLKNHSLKALHFQEKNIYPGSLHNDRSYFVEDIFKKVLSTKKKTKKNIFNKRRLHRLLLMVFGAAFIISATWLTVTIVHENNLATIAQQEKQVQSSKTALDSALNANDDNKKIFNDLKIYLTLAGAKKADPDVVAKARDVLQNLPLSQLIFLSLDDKCSAGDFKKIYDKQIPYLAHNLTELNWILGDNFQPKLEGDEIDDIVNNTRSLFINAYITRVVNFDNINQATQQLDSIVKFKVAPQDIQPHLQKFTNYIKSIATNPNQNQAAFNAISEYLENDKTNELVIFEKFAAQQPEETRTWLQPIIQNSVSILLPAAHNYINSEWKKTIVIQYQQTLANKYPLTSGSATDITIDDFNHFFGPQGSMDTFFSTYIKPFVNTDAPNWTWKNINNHSLMTAQNSLEVFVHATLIQKMFYPNNAAKPRIEFILEPIEMTPNTQSFNLHIDSQKISYAGGVKQKYSVVWPGPNPGSVAIDFTDDNGKYFTTSKFGPWALFKMLDNTNLAPEANNQYFEITFDLNGNSIKYRLIPTAAVSPFIPNILSDFNCPNSLD